MSVRKLNLLLVMTILIADACFPVAAHTLFYFMLVVSLC